MAYINGLETMFSARIGSGLTAEEILEMVYPVGSVYISASATSPASFMGGTWEQLKDRFLVGAGSAYANGATGGEATHTLTEAEMPSHRHLIYMTHDGTTEYWGPEVVRQQSTVQSSISGYTGGDQPHNNMPPYLAVNLWKRSA
jgi:hypothetical protein